ncbi:hypothetical protein F5884DRAFT_801081 [Xylogone sp. PMI_703]|nr:hypothetical protein F5884DRAFT_801081 [Xylogone sp. PMI_703]
MASSAGRDDENRSDQNKSENPFIRFKHFADSQISALLQGIVGLPSAISRLPPVNPQWAEFDKNTRHRDDAKEEENDLKKSEVEGSTKGGDDGEEIIIPVKKSWDQKPSIDEHAEDGIALDLPLYSPVTKSLFASLDPSDKSLDWPNEDQARRDNSGSSFLFDHMPIFIRYGERPSSVMKIVQLLAYNNLKSRTDLRSDSSILPYLLFSPYSPIKLSLESNSYRETQSSGPPDDFPYQEAFEDLILTTQGHHIGRPMWPRLFNRGGLLDFPFFDSHIMRAGSAIAWIYQLSAYRLLEPIGQGHQVNTQVSTWDGFRRAANSSETEEDMYNEFLRGSETTQPKNSIFLTRYKEAIDRQFRELEKASKEIRRTVEPETTSKDEFDDVDEFHGMLGNEMKKLEAELSVAKRKLERLTSEITVQSKHTTEQDQVVATITSQDTRVREDGTVETTVQIRRRFADGRETITTKTSIGETDYDDAYGSSTEQETENDTKDGAKEGKNKKKGWFWS